MKKLSLLLLLTFLCLGSIQAQSELTTFILVRHAEKANDDPRDPTLSIDGEVRAEMLAQLLADQEITAIYSTPFKRTRDTAKPLAQMKRLEVEIYDFRSSTYLQDMLKAHKGGTVLISGHSNTTPMIANTRLGEERFKTLDENEYGKIFIISVSEIGEGKVTMVRY